MGVTMRTSLWSPPSRWPTWGWGWRGLKDLVVGYPCTKNEPHSIIWTPWSTSHFIVKNRRTVNPTVRSIQVGANPGSSDSDYREKRKEGDEEEEEEGKERGGGGVGFPTRWTIRWAPLWVANKCAWKKKCAWAYFCVYEWNTFLYFTIILLFFSKGYWAQGGDSVLLTLCKLNVTISNGE